MLLVSHPTGNTFVRALLEGAQRRRQLGTFATTISFHGSLPLTRLLPAALGAELGRRRFTIPRDRLETHPVREWVRLSAAKLGFAKLVRHELGWASIDAVYRDLDRHVAGRLVSWRAKHRLTAVHTYEDGALETLRVAESLGLRRVYDLPIAYWQTSQRLLREEAGRWPEWEPTLVGTRDSEEKLRRKTAELEAAEVVICPSRFVLESLPEAARREKRCVIAEFGSPISPSSIPARPANGKLRVLFAGSMTQRKGLADLFAAVRQLRRSDLELVVMGSFVAKPEFYRRQLSEFTYEPPRPHAAVLSLMQNCDLLALPSIVEGRALVQQEAMCCGLPIVVTPNAGGEDLVVEGETGFLVPMRDPVHLAQKLAWCCDHRREVAEMGRAAQRKATTYTWTRYSERILDQLDAALPERR